MYPIYVIPIVQLILRFIHFTPAVLTAVHIPHDNESHAIQRNM